MATNVMYRLPNKHTAAEITIFSRMSALAQQHNAVNLSQGFPDFPVDARLGEFLLEAVTNGYNQYAPMSGLPMLRAAVANDLDSRYLLAVDSDTEITVTPGATYGIYTAITALIEPRDEVIVLEPAYDSYIPNIELAGGIPVPIPMVPLTYRVDWDLVNSKVTDKTRVIVINTPHNPTGMCFDSADWQALAAIVRNKNIYIVSDEVYEQIIFDGKQHQSVLMHPELRQRSFAVFSFGKAHNNTGWKMGYVIAPPELTHAFRKVHQYIAFCTNAPAQYAIAKYLSTPREAPNALMQAKRDYCLQKLESTPFTVHAPAAGSYFQLISYSTLSSLPDTDFAEWLTINYGVATVPLSAFYQSRRNDKLVRLCFAKREETLDIAMERLASLTVTS
jgi:methionine transaminase